MGDIFNGRYPEMIARAAVMAIALVMMAVLVNTASGMGDNFRIRMTMLLVSADT